MLLLVEAAIVGICMSVVLATIVAARPIGTAWEAAAIGFVIGAAFHLTFEFTGLNAAYCTSGHACVT